MDSLQIYSDIIENAQSKNRKKLKRDDENYVYYERHHILPRCVEGGNEKENLVLLTAKEHFVCHKLLVEIFPEEPKLINAYFLMCTKASSSGERNYKVGLREYEKVKELYSKLVSERQIGEKNHMYGKSGELSPTFGKIPTKEVRKKMSESQKGRRHPEEVKLKISKANIGLKRSEEAKKNMKNGCKNKKNIACLYCGKIMDAANAKKYHFDNCPDNPKNNKEEILKKRSESSPMYGKKHKLITCPHCNKIGGSGSMSMWHFDNCKKNPKNKDRIFKQKIVTCSHCNKEGGISNMKRYHFDNCKHKINKPYE